MTRRAAEVIMSLVHAAPLVPQPTSGGRLVAPDGRTLPFRGGTLSVDAAGGVARVVLRQRFVNPYAEPLRVTYQVPLPADAAVSGYAFELADERITGEVDRRSRARERFEEALIDGRTAALLEEDRSSLFTQEVGNVPGGAEVVCELVLDQRLAWVAQGWEWRFPTVVAPRYLGQEGRVSDAGRVTVDVAEAGTDARLTLGLHVRDALTGPLKSPTHPNVLEDGVALDRDIVVRWPVSTPVPGLTVDVARGTNAFACALLTLVPPTQRPAAVPRDLIVLLDTSGSMSGRPLAQAQAVTLALIDTLGEADQLEILEFSSRPHAWQAGPVSANAANRAAARRWVSGLRAGGGTEMREGIVAALAAIRGEAQRQVILVTDGLIGFESEIVREVAERLPRGSRVHTLGIGSGVNRSLLTPVARAGGGIEVIVGLDEEAGEAAARLVAATAAPLVVDLVVGGSAVIEVAHHRAPDLLAGRPAILAVRLRAEGGTITVAGHTAAGPWAAERAVAPVAVGAGSPAVRALVGRELIEEAELRGARGESVDAAVEQLGLDYQLATRLTSWVAVSHQRTVDPTAPTRRERVPQALPYGTSVTGLGLRSAAPPPAMAGGSQAILAMPSAAPMRSRAEATRRPAAPAAAPPQRAKKAGPLERAKEFFADLLAPLSDEAARPPVAPPRTLRGRLVLAADGRWVLEVDVPADLPWFPVEAATVLTRAGATVAVTLDRAASTAPAHLSAGQVLRITLVFAGPAPTDAFAVSLVAEPRSGLVVRVEW